MKKSFLSGLAVLTLAGTMLIDSNANAKATAPHAVKTVKKTQPVKKTAQKPHPVKKVTKKAKPIKKQTSKKINLVNNSNITIHNQGYSTGVPFDVMTASSGQLMTFGTKLALPTNWPSPQSMVITPDEEYAYVLYNAHGNYNNSSDYNFIVRFDLDYLTKTYVSSSSSDLKVGPTFKGGAKQTLAYNAKKDQLWLSGSPRNSSSTDYVKSISLSTLKPTTNTKVKGLTGNGVNTLAFDKKGNAYSYAQSNGGHNGPKGSIVLYRGTVTKKQAKFERMQTVIRHAPGTTPKSMAYDPRNNRLYLVSDDALLSLPVNKLNHMHVSDLTNTIFNSQREFKGMAFNNKGTRFLLLNRYPEIMQSKNN